MLKIHHIGYVVRSIDDFKDDFIDLKLINSTIDEIQNAKLSIFEQANEKILIELIEPLTEKSFTWKHLEKNDQSMHHICYEGISFDKIKEICSIKKMIIVRGPLYAKLFDKEIVFVMSRNKTLFEFIL